MQRALASITRITELTPIAGADRIELARVAGWQCVVKKGEFRPGELAVYLEIDAVPPDREAFSWLWQPKGQTGVPRPDSFRIRTLRLRGTLSQGLLMPLAQAGLTHALEGADVTEQLGVIKYEPPAPSGMGDWRAAFPSLVPKTDEMRVQAVPQVLEELRGKPFVATVKMDGTSSTFVMIDGGLHACGRNHSIAEGENLYWHVARKHRLADVLGGSSLALQGEIVGPGVQKNPAGLKDKSLFVFNLYDTRTGEHLSDGELRKFCQQHGLMPVPLAFEGARFDETVDSLLQKAEGTYENTGNQREGIVIRPVQPMRSDVLGGRLSFKAISNRYLLDERD
ncbi:MAG: RNA ligase (ATP) [Archangium sp.]|nr:RNA ligase (ATP) [Archangium sp.]MDP3571990.1 RNA ligase (ATP) [Archangium sp.]